ncbi:MAG: hypothetical protein KTR20_14100 [Cellvibrionaceae bacterium]|nr:hypothetical protein [Cellvibrionaceae bacterium]
MKDKKNIMGFLPTKVDNFPPAFTQDFIHHIQNGYKPSYSLRQLMKTYELEKMHPFLVVDLFRLAYPGMLLLHLGAWLYKNNYPASTALVSDSEFDEMIDDLLRKSYTPQ